MNDESTKKDSHLFAVQYTDEDFVAALHKCIENATVPASCVADVLGCNPRYATVRLKDLRERGCIEGELRGKAWGFRPKK
jgi:hypothetical protein